MSEIETIIVESSECGDRLDQILAKRFQGHYSRSYFQFLIEEGLVLVNGELFKKRYKPHAGDEIEIEFALTSAIDLSPEPIPLEILYEDEALLAVNKAAGLVVHPAPGHWSGTFVHGLLYHCQIELSSSAPLRPGIVHRLDKDTSGVLLAAKTAECQRRLIEAFSKRQVRKKYFALVHGYPSQSLIDAPIGRSLKNRQKMGVIASGKPARSHLKVLQKGEGVSFLEIDLETGRTHQIRVHLSSIGTPIIGDKLYGNLEVNRRYFANRQLLHAARLEFSHPLTGEALKIEAPLPEDFKKALARFSFREIILD